MYCVYRISDVLLVSVYVTLILWVISVLVKFCIGASLLKMIKFGGQLRMYIVPLVVVIVGYNITTTNSKVTHSLPMCWFYQ